MCKKISILLFLLAVAFMPMTNVLAEPNATILIEDLVYTMTESAAMPHSLLPETGQLFYAEGEGTINCNGVAACQEAGLNGQTVIIQQGFCVEIQGVQAGYFTVSTVGSLHLPNELPAINFAGLGDGTLECAAETCDLIMELDTQMPNGRQLSFSLVAINIDHTSAGIVCDTIEGLAVIGW